TADDRDKLPAIVAHLRIDRDEKSRTAHVAKRLKLSKHQRIYLRHSAGLGNIAVRAEHAAAIVLALSPSDDRFGHGTLYARDELEHRSRSSVDVDAANRQGREKVYQPNRKSWRSFNGGVSRVGLLKGPGRMLTVSGSPVEFRRDSLNQQQFGEIVDRAVLRRVGWAQTLVVV